MSWVEENFHEFKKLENVSHKKFKTENILYYCKILIFRSTETPQIGFESPLSRFWKLPKQ